MQASNSRNMPFHIPRFQIQIAKELQAINIK
jgi:hypothetical protein